MSRRWRWSWSAPLGDLVNSDTGSLESNAAIFDALIDLAQVQAGRSVDHSIFLAQTAAHFAWLNHPGRHASLALEVQIADLASREYAPVARPREGRVVHILTRALAIGGHSRLAWRWIQADRGRQSSVVLTGQGWHRVPAALAESVATSGGSLIDLSLAADTLARRARRLRSIVADSEFVVLHTHPFDVVPSLAFAGWTGKPPVLLMNHADHVFWVGAMHANVVIDFRHSGSALTRGRRGIAPERQALVPLPVPPARPISRRNESRAALGISPDDVLAVSVAQPYKFRPGGGWDYIDTMCAAIDAIPSLRVVVVGPKDVGAWREARDRTAGRLQAVGYLDDLSSVYQAADIYVDSMPFGSLTSLLEAGTNGLPLILAAPTPGLEVLSPDSPGLDEVVLQGRSSGEIVDHLRRLASDGGLRRMTGAVTVEAILAVSAGDGWTSAMEDAYAASTGIEGTGTADPVRDVAARFDLLAMRLAEIHEEGGGLEAAIAEQLRYAPVVDRLSLTARLLPPSRAMAPDWVRGRLRGFVGR